MTEQAGLRLGVPVELRWADCDQYGHVNNVALVRLVEEARIRLFGLPDMPSAFSQDRPTPALAALGTGTFTIVAGQRLEYLNELPYSGQSVVAEAWLSRIGGRSIAMDFRLSDPVGGTDYVIASVTVVVMDVATRRPRSLTEAETAGLAGYLGPGVTFR